jgi:hypothetical protein
MLAAPPGDFNQTMSACRTPPTQDPWRRWRR